MTEYFYQRDLVNNNYDIENKQRVDLEGNHIYLAFEIEQGLPNKLFRIFCSGSECKIIFDIELTPEEKGLLDTIVYNHKHNL